MKEFGYSPYTDWYVYKLTYEHLLRNGIGKNLTVDAFIDIMSASGCNLQDMDNSIMEYITVCCSNSKDVYPDDYTTAHLTSVIAFRYIYINFIKPYKKYRLDELAEPTED